MKITSDKMFSFNKRFPTCRLKVRKPYFLNNKHALMIEIEYWHRDYRRWESYGCINEHVKTSADNILFINLNNPDYQYVKSLLIENDIASPTNNIIHNNYSDYEEWHVNIDNLRNLAADFNIS